MRERNLERMCEKRCQGGKRRAVSIKVGRVDLRDARELIRIVLRASREVGRREERCAMAKTKKRQVILRFTCEAAGTA